MSQWTNCLLLLSGKKKFLLFFSSNAVNCLISTFRSSTPSPEFLGFKGYESYHCILPRRWLSMMGGCRDVGETAAGSGFLHLCDVEGGVRKGSGGNQGPLPSNPMFFLLHYSVVTSHAPFH